MKKLIAILIMITFLLTGCWDFVETEDLAVIRVMGVGLDEDNNIRVVIQEIPHEKQTVSGGSSGGSNSTPFHLFAETGATISEALQKMTAAEHHKLFLAHLDVLILDEDLVSQNGIEPIIDFFIRNPKIRLGVWTLISPKGELDKIFTTDIGLNIDNGEILDETIYNEKMNPFRTVNKISSIINMLYSHESEIYTAGVLLDSKSSIVKSGPGKKPPTKKFHIENTAVFKNGKMIGWLKDKEQRGFSWVTEHVKGGIVTIPYEEGSISLTINKVKSRIKPIINKEKMQIEIYIDILSNIIESQVNYNFMNEDIIEKIQQIHREQVKEEITAAIEASIDLDSDFLGFGNSFNMHYPKYWNEIKNDWYSHFKDIEVSIHVNSVIKNIGNNYKPIIQ